MSTDRISDDRDRVKGAEARTEVLMWYAMMLGAAKAMPEAARKELEEWERLHLDGTYVGTSDWPGWEELIGPRPRSDLPLSERKTPRDPISAALRKQVFERDAYRCVQCGDWHELHLDHIIPFSRGGPTTFENLQTLCRTCNLKKGDRL